MEQQNLEHQDGLSTIKTSQFPLMVENILESISDGFYLLDRDWRFTYINKNSEKLTLRSREELLGKIFWEEFPEIVGSTFEENYRRAIREQTVVSFEEFYPPLNTWFEVRAYPSPQGLSLYFHNVTKRKRRERNLALLADLQKDFASFLSIDEILRVTGEKIAQYLNLSHCLFVEINTETEEATVFYDYHAAEVKNLSGVYRLNDFHTDSERRQLAEGKVIVIGDVRDSPRPATAAAEFEALGIRSLANAPYLSGGKWKFSLSAQRPQPYQWSEDECELLSEIAARVYLRLEYARAEITLRESEEKYRTLFTSIDEGFCVFEVIFGENGKVIDYRFLETNSTFEQQTGLTQIVGKTMRELVPDHESFWFETYGKVALTGQPVRFEHKSAALNRWYDVYAFRVNDPASRKVAALFKDTTARKKVELNLAFLAEVSKDLVRLTGVKEIMQTAAAKIGRHLNLSVCNFVEINEAADEAVINYSWHRADVPATAGVFRLSDFVTSEFQEAGRAGEIFAVNNTKTDSRTNSEKYAARQVAALLSVPFIRNGRWQFVLAAYHSQPHDWQTDEIEILRELTTRVWTRLEQARSEELINENRRRLQTALEAGRMGSWELNIANRELILSDNCKIIYGRQPDDEFTYQNLVDCICEQDREEWRAAISKAIKNRADFEIEYRVLWQDQSVHWVLVRGSCFTDETDKTSWLAGVSIDITASKQAEQSLRERARVDNLYGKIGNALVQTENLENLLVRCSEALVECLDVALARIWVFDETKNVLELRANAGLQMPLNEADDCIPPGISEIGLIAEERQPHLTNDIFNDLQMSDKDWARREGIKSFAGYPLIIEERLIGVMGTFSRHPLTALTLEAMESVSKGIANAIERKRVEEERRQLLINEQHTRRAAEDANNLKDEFLATLSHELRTPLNAILGWAQVLQSHKLDEDETKKAIATIERNARSQTRLIEDILDVSRIITGKLRLNIRAVDLASVIVSAVESVRPASEAKGIRLQTLLDSETAPISGDYDRLQQVVWNLLSNAIKFTPKDGRVQVRLERVNSHVEIVVSDTGKGIEPDFLSFAFDRFRQSDGSMTRRHGGLGLGLAIVRQLVELHGGQVTVESEGAGQGSTFIVSLPLLPVRREPASEIPRVHPAAQASRSIDCSVELDGLSVLLVDDELDSLELLDHLLNSCGANVTTASSAFEALKFIKQERFDVFISDIGMPEEDGFTLIQKIRELPNDQGGDIPAIALTAYARPEDRVKAIRSGFQMHIAKPVDSSELVAAVANLAGRIRKSIQRKNYN